MSYFAYQTAAERYASNRPFFHPLVIAKAKEYLQLEQPLDHALDVGCGTGQSTVALTAIAHRVTGIDVSQEMLSFAQRYNTSPTVTYIHAPAESIPLPDASSNLITASLAFHWFERSDFLNEARRLLCPAGWLVIYNNAFTGRMHENPAFEQWVNQQYLLRYPNPPRNNQPLIGEDISKHGFQFLHREHYTNDISFTLEELVAYLMTQSNIIAVVEQGVETLTSVRAWLTSQITPYFTGAVQTFLLAGYVWYLQRT
jgi:ubiquinone/menaquinone biosynthesis C-methylase UbiE